MPYSIHQPGSWNVTRVVFFFPLICTCMPTSNKEPGSRKTIKGFWKRSNSIYITFFQVFWMKSKNEIHKQPLGCCVFQCFPYMSGHPSFKRIDQARFAEDIGETKQLILWFYVSKMAMLSITGCFCRLINGTKRAFWLTKVDWINVSLGMLIFYTYRCLGSFALEITGKGLWIVVSGVS